MPSKVTLEQLVQGIQFKDPRLYDALKGIVAELRKLSKDVTTLARADITEELIDVFPPTVLVFTATIHPLFIRLEWTQPSSTTVQYELRRGSDWDTAERILITSSLSADVDPLLAGTYTFLLKSIDSNGTYSIDPASVDVTIDVPEGVTLTARVIDNNVLLSWNIPTSDFKIAYYELEKDGVSIGQVFGTFAALFESLAGSYVYSVAAVDIAGNIGIETSVMTAVTQPPDYELSALFLSDLTGTRTNVALETGPKLIACADIIETWQQHFVNNSWDSPQEQIDAGYPYYIQPIPTPGTYLETKDFGAVFANVIVNLDWDFVNIVGSVGVSATLEVSDDNVTYTAPIVGITSFFASVRYVRVTLTFTPADDMSFMEFFNFRILLDVKREIDSGNVDALAADLSGTPVLFTKPFKDIDSITVTALSTTVATAIYDFVDVPNPTGFSVYVYNATGTTRLDRTVSWKARGVV